MEQLLLTNGTIFDVIEGVYRKADLLVQDDKIAQIAPNIEATEDMRIIDVQNRFIFPGFIDAHSHIGVLFQFPDANDCNECSNPSTQRMRIVDALRYDDPCLLENAQMGVTTVMITPGSGNVICGQAAIIKTYAERPFDMIVNDYAAFKLALGENPKSVYGPLNRMPMSRMGTASIITEFLERGLIYRDKRAAGGEINLDYEMLLPVLNREIPCKIHCHRADDILTAIRIMKKYNLRYTIDHCTEGYMIMDELASANAPVIVGPLFMFKSKPEVRNANPYQAIALNEKGIMVSVSSDHNITDSRFLGMVVGQLVKQGLPYADGIKMLTINPATALGMKDRIGSLETGKDADLFVCDGNPLEIRSNITMTMIGGKLVPGMEVS